MRILKLQLKAFGPFTGKDLDFSTGGLQIVYGSNGVGKSCSLRALKGLLFGIDPKSTDDFIHNGKSLRIGGCLQHSDGTTLEIVRRKGNKNTLMGPGNEPLTEDALDRFLAGVGAEAFGTMFGIDHDALIRGAGMLLKGGGELGNTLFAAATGGTDPAALLAEFDAESQALFAPRGRTQAINKAVSEYGEARKRVSEYSVPTLNWAVQDATLSKARRDREDVQRQIDESMRDRNRLERLQRLWPPVSKRHALLSRLESLQDVTLLPRDFSDRRKAALNALHTARSTKEETAVELERLRQEKAAIDVPEAILESSEAINALNQRFGSHRKGNQDLEKLHGRRQQLEADREMLLRELPTDVQDHATQERIPVDRRTRLQTLGAKQETLDAALSNARKAVARASRQLAAAREEYEGLPPETGVEILRGAVDRALQQGDIVQAHRKAVAAVQLEEEQTFVELKRLPHWDRDVQALEQLPVPGRESLDRFESVFQTLNGKSERIADQIRKSEQELAEIESRIVALEISGQVPIEKDLHLARERREQGWQLLRRAWLGQEDVAAEAHEYGNGIELPAAFEAQVALADEIADRLRREADRVAQRAALIAQRVRLVDALSRLRTDRDTLHQDIAKEQALWIALWIPSGIEPQNPREMRTWLDRRDRLVERAGNLRALRHDADMHQSQIQKHSAELREGLKTTGSDLAHSNEHFNALLDMARSVVGVHDQTESRRRELRKTIGRLEEELERARLEEKQAGADIKEWNRNWTELLQAAGFPPRMKPAEAIALLAKLEELFSKTADLHQIRHRIDGIDGIAAEFEADVRALAQRIAPESLRYPVEQLVPHLYSCLTRALSDRATFDGLAIRIKDKETLFHKCVKAIEGANRELSDLCSQARCADHAELSIAEERSAEAIDLRKQIDALEENILELGHAAELDPLIREVLSEQADSLPPGIAELSVRIRELEESRSQVDRIIGAATTELSKIDGTSKAAEEAERAQSIVAGARESIERYVRLRVASTILRQEIENYRVRNQAPLLTRAQELFSTLTLQAFTSLTTEYDDEQDVPKLKAIRPNGEAVGTEGLSDGTRDQLYLSLRLASLEQYLHNNEAMPFVVDDILIRFDDERAAATLNVLGELSKKTQVLFFTHHGRLVELARSVKAVPVAIYHLDNASGAQTAMTGS